MPLPDWFWETDPTELPSPSEVVLTVEPTEVETKANIIAQYLATAGGRQKLAASMAAPLRARRDYDSFVRRTFPIQQLPDGALPIYGKDPKAVALVVGEEGRAHPASE
jgi:hypothetical protein